MDVEITQSTIITDYYVPEIYQQPRMPRILFKAEKTKEHHGWRYNKSIFRSFRRETPVNTITLCLENDR